jgi:hypothetical protein
MYLVRMDIVTLVIAWVFAVVSAVFFRRSLNLTGDHLNVKMFRTAGLLVLIGAVLTIVIVGAVISLVANILLAVAFFQIRAGPPHRRHSLHPHPKTSVKASISEPAKPLCLTHTATGSSSSGSPSNASPASVTSMSSRTAGL